MPEYLEFPKVQDKTCQQLAAYSKRIADLLANHKHSGTALVACLDDLLGAVYNLFYLQKLLLAYARVRLERGNDDRWISSPQA